MTPKRIAELQAYVRNEGRAMQPAAFDLLTIERAELAALLDIAALLAAREAAVIERCAKVAEDCGWKAYERAEDIRENAGPLAVSMLEAGTFKAGTEAAAAAIRAMKPEER